MSLFTKGMAACALFCSLFISFNATASIVDSKSHAGTAYFLFSSPNKIIRYDMVSQAKLADIALTKTPSAFTIHEGKAYVAFGRELRVIDLMSGTNTFIRNSSSDITDVLILNGFIRIVEQRTTLTILDLQTFSLISNENIYESVYKPIASEQQNAIYYHSSEQYGTQVKGLFYKQNGDKDLNTYTPYFDHKTGTKSYINSSQNKIYSNSGTVYFAYDLSYAKSLNTDFDNLTFADDNPILTKDNTLLVFNSSDVKVGEVSLTSPADFIAVENDTVFSFDISDSNISVSTIDISEFDLPALNAPADAASTSFTPDLYINDGKDVLYIYDRETLSIFRWSTIQQQYLPTLRLNNPPSWISFSEDHGRLYLDYSKGKITYFSIDDVQIENIFLDEDVNHYGMVTADPYLVVIRASEYGQSLNSYDEAGSHISTLDWALSGNEYLWNPIAENIYIHGFRDNNNYILSRKLNVATGEFIYEDNSPYFSGNPTTRHPLILSHDSSLLLNGTGHIIDVETLVVSNSLSNTISSGVWIGDQLVTIRALSPSLQLWNDDYSLDYELTLNSFESYKVFNVDGKLLLVTEGASELGFSIFYLSNIPDTDSDGLHDLQDNCINQANIDQADFDQDGSGDACDHDDDNDTIPDELELAIGLNPKDLSDADDDLDGDGYNNRIEFNFDSILDDELSFPAAVETYNENFENGWPKGFFTSPNNLGWIQSNNGKNSIGSISSKSFSNKSLSSEINFSALFSAGVISFDYQFNDSYEYDYQLQVFVDGNIVYDLSYTQDEGWMTVRFSIPEGVHTISWVVIKQYDWMNTGEKFVSIDNFSFEQDQDNDRIPDSSDNCPANNNPGQYDSDDDHIGDECDNDPYNDDSDGDGFGSWKDNCPSVANPDQIDIDFDGLGDACDESDDRPKDSDADGVYDYYDNCINIANTTQNDTDLDYLGDACDDDIDGDGITNTLENSYSFMDAYDASDVNEDEDSDGAANGFEINSGKAPDSYDKYEPVYLLDYYVLGEASYTFKDLYYDYEYEVEIRKGKEKNHYTFNYTGFMATHAIKSDGVYRISGNYTDDSAKFVYNNWLVMPLELKLGQLVRRAGSIDVYEADEKVPSYTSEMTLSIQLIEIGERTWNGKKYPSITLRHSSKENNSPEEYVTDITYIKGIGDIGGDGYLLTSAEVIKNDHASKAKKDGSSGSGSTDLWIFALLTIFFVTPRKWRLNID